jgi:signal transduction histidine kinase/CheY-like chemotaxis protein
MNWTPELLIGITANSLTSVITVALMLLVTSQAPRRAESWLFGLIMLNFSVTGMVGVFIHFAVPLEFNPARILYFSTSLYALNVVLLFLFSARFSGMSTRLTWALTLTGLLMISYLIPLLWMDKVYTDFHIASSGSHYNYVMASSGIPGLIGLILFKCVSALMLYARAEKHARGLWMAPAILVMPMLMFVIPWFDTFPKTAVSIAISAILVAQIVLRYQLFNPLAKLNKQLADANVRLTDASARLIETNARLTEVSQLKSQFLANMSHELRTPLNSIIGYSELVLEQIYGPLTDTQRDRLEKVSRNGRHLLSLINDILDLSKIEAGKLDLTIETVNLRDMIGSVLAGMDVLACEKKITLVRDFDHIPQVLADPQRAEQIITNLVSNAIKFTDSGSITVHGQVDANSGMVRVSVIDTGIGIKPEDMIYIFDEFRQVDGTTTRRHNGTGLGLAITKRLVEMHGGSIWVDSTPTLGSTFAFTLPVAETIPVEVHDRKILTGPLALVIDDSPEAAGLIRDILTTQGYKVQIAPNGQEGLALARTLHPALITLDVMMPGLKGWDVLRILKTDADTAAIPVIMISVIESKPLGLDVSANAYLTKPIDRCRLITLAHTLSAQPEYPVLIVDDNPQDREILAAMLETEHISSQSVASGEEAIRWLREHRAALVLLDVMMPQLSGFDVLVHIREQSNQRDLPVIVVSAKDLTPQERLFLQTRLADLVQKQGLVPQKLVERTRAALASNHATPVQ